MAYVCLECDYEQETPGDCPDCGIALVEERVETGPEKTDSDLADEGLEDKSEEW